MRYGSGTYILSEHFMSHTFTSCKDHYWLQWLAGYCYLQWEQLLKSKHERLQLANWFFFCNLYTWELNFAVHRVTPTGITKILLGAKLVILIPLQQILHNFIVLQNLQHHRKVHSPCNLFILGILGWNLTLTISYFNTPTNPTQPNALPALSTSPWRLGK